MVMTGELKLHKDTVDYAIYSGGNYYNLSEKMKTILMEKTSVVVQKDNQIIFCEEGKLEYRKSIPNSNVYDLYVGDQNLGELLWGLVGSRISIEIKNEVKDWRGEL